MSDIDIEDYFFYLQKENRKKMEKAYSGVKFDQILLSLNDKGTKEEEEYPFEKQRIDLKLHQDKLKSHIKGYLTYFFNK